MKTTYILISFCFILMSCQAKTDKKQNQNSKVDSIDIEIFNSLKQITKAIPFDSMSAGNRIIETGKFFLQTPYVGGTLENDEQEELVINLHQLDCTTYLENVLAFSQSLSEPEFSGFSKNLKSIRYRDGKIEDYTSRLHYFTDWIIDNEKKGLLTNITKEIGGETYNKIINFMSEHISSYPALTRDSSLIKKIKETEKRLNLHVSFYIPEDKIHQVEDKIHDGDFIAITTNIKGLDVSHTGIAIHLNNRLHLMHASSKEKKVVISDRPLAEMIQRNRLQSGIIVARITIKQ
ncbi:DUF1460 domain-containing protein [Ancylomarina sp. DW003]|nr:N-acetylmuramoyl-L-alanine amidase-like domain-containing protein [Ancylomarina sp. DW003]MDE5421174.1 DUF1460 domain-containing protein [Ancylomarina sp. DW003]